MDHALRDRGLKAVCDLLRQVWVDWRLCRRGRDLAGRAARKCGRGLHRCRLIAIQIVVCPILDRVQRRIEVVDGLLLARNIIFARRRAEALCLLKDELYALGLCLRRHVLRPRCHCLIAGLDLVIGLLHPRFLRVRRLVCRNRAAECAEQEGRHKSLGDLLLGRLFVRRSIPDRLIDRRIAHAAGRLPHELEERCHKAVLAQNVCQPRSDKLTRDVARSALCAAHSDALQIIAAADVPGRQRAGILNRVYTRKGQRSARHVEPEAACFQARRGKPSARRFADAAHQRQRTGNARAARQIRMFRLRIGVVLLLLRPSVIRLVRHFRGGMKQHVSKRLKPQPLHQAACDSFLSGVKPRIERVVDLLPLPGRFCVVFANGFLIRCKRPDVLFTTQEARPAALRSNGFLRFLLLLLRPRPVDARKRRQTLLVIPDVLRCVLLRALRFLVCLIDLVLVRVHLILPVYLGLPLLQLGDGVLCVILFLPERADRGECAPDLLPQAGVLAPFLFLLRQRVDLLLEVFGLPAQDLLPPHFLFLIFHAYSASGSV